jgi:transposase
LLPDREGETLTDWLKQYPSIETVSRDRSSTYASATTEADEKIVQTGGVPLADRWHILKNLTEGWLQLKKSASFTTTSVEFFESDKITFKRFSAA